jgi:hypothetical protein
MLAEVKIFKGLNEEQIARLAEMLTPELFTPGERIIRAGDQGDNESRGQAGRRQGQACYQHGDEHDQPCPELGGGYGSQDSEDEVSYEESRRQEPHLGVAEAQGLLHGGKDKSVRVSGQAQSPHHRQHAHAQHHEGIVRPAPILLSWRYIIWKVSDSNIPGDYTPGGPSTQRNWIMS